MAFSSPVQGKYTTDAFIFSPLCPQVGFEVQSVMQNYQGVYNNDKLKM